MTEIKRLYIYRRNRLREYLWPDGTIHNMLCGTVELIAHIALKDYPGYFETKGEASRVLNAYNKKQKELND